VKNYCWNSMARSEAIPTAGLALLRAMVLILALVLSGMAHAGGFHFGDVGSLPTVTALNDATPVHEPCDDSSNYALNEVCSQAAGCAFGIPAQASIAYEPFVHCDTAQAVVDLHHSTTAAPPIRPPRLSVQA
jgi:hypothetical protein